MCNVKLYIILSVGLRIGYLREKKIWPVMVSFIIQIDRPFLRTSPKPKRFTLLNSHRGWAYGAVPFILCNLPFSLSIQNMAGGGAYTTILKFRI